MKYDELAFVNQQLAGMLKSGLPLEGGLRQLCAQMRRGALRRELELLEDELAKGTPLKTALAARQLPALYVRMLALGVQSNNLPGVLIMLADYYQGSQLLWARLKGLLVYPTLVLALAFVSSLVISLIYAPLETQMEMLVRQPLSSTFVQVGIIMPPVILAVLLVLVLGILLLPGSRRWLYWRFPGFKEAQLSQSAALMALMLRNGGKLDESLGLLRELEKNSRAEADIRGWQAQLANGCTRFADMAAQSKVFPPLFIWLVAASGEELCAGFQHAAEIYRARALHKIELFLYAVLPVSILTLGIMIIGQIIPVFRYMIQIMDALGTGM